MPDELTEESDSPEAQITEYVVETWFESLTDAAKQNISDHDLNALRHGILAGLKGEVLIRQPAMMSPGSTGIQPEN